MVEFINFPNEILLFVFKFVNVKDLMSLGYTCKLFHQVISETHLWDQKFLELCPNSKEYSRYSVLKSKLRCLVICHPPTFFNSEFIWLFHCVSLPKPIHLRYNALELMNFYIKNTTIEQCQSNRIEILNIQSVVNFVIDTHNLFVMNTNYDKVTMILLDLLIFYLKDSFNKNFLRVVNDKLGKWLVSLLSNDYSTSVKQSALKVIHYTLFDYKNGRQLYKNGFIKKLVDLLIYTDDEDISIMGYGIMYRYISYKNSTMIKDPSFSRYMLNLFESNDREIVTMSLGLIRQYCFNVESCQSLHRNFGVLKLLKTFNSTSDITLKNEILLTLFKISSINSMILEGYLPSSTVKLLTQFMIENEMIEDVQFHCIRLFCALVLDCYFSKKISARNIISLIDTAAENHVNSSDLFLTLKQHIKNKLKEHKRSVCYKVICKLQINKIVYR